MKEPQIEFSIKSDVSLVAFAGKALSALLAGTGLPKSKIGTFELAVVEVVTNVIEHAYEFKPGYQVDLSFMLTNISAEVRVRDYGRPLSPEVVDKYISEDTEVQLPGDSLADLPISGWGTSLVAKLCDEVRYEQVEDCNVLTLVCHLNSESDEALQKAG